MSEKNCATINGNMQQNFNSTRPAGRGGGWGWVEGMSFKLGQTGEVVDNDQAFQERNIKSELEGRKERTTRLNLFMW